MEVGKNHQTHGSWIRLQSQQRRQGSVLPPQRMQSVAFEALNEGAEVNVRAPVRPQGPARAQRPPQHLCLGEGASVGFDTHAPPRSRPEAGRHEFQREVVNARTPADQPLFIGFKADNSCGSGSRP